MHLETFSEGRSLLHKLDPRVKILVYVPLVFIIAPTMRLPVGLGGLGLALGLILLARVNLQAVLNRLIFVNVFILVLWFTLPFSIPGQPLFFIGRTYCSLEGVLLTVLISLKANVIILLTVALLGTTEIFALAHALFHLRLPKKLVYLFFFFYRYITVLHEEFDRLMAVVKLRGFVAQTGAHTIKTLAYLVGMLFVRSYERSQRIYQALTLRGFRGDFPLIAHFHLHRYDIVFAGGMTCCMVVLLLL
jgi:cobalt/nickel transport system permease protein